MIRKVYLPVYTLCFLFAISITGSRALAQKKSAHVDPKLPPKLGALSAILMDAETGQVLFEKNADKPRPPASTTKIMTAILLIENTEPGDVIVSSKVAQETGGSSLHLAKNEKVTARDMLYALMLRSANDGCVAVAEHIAGSESKFAQMMTAKAKEIGATHTSFHNSNGLKSDSHFTSARDLAIMAKYAAQYPEFNEATRSKWHTIRRTINTKDVKIKNHAKFLWQYKGADGIKTGWTVPAGKCFVGSATRNGWRLISVVLNSPDIFGETAKLMNYGFAAFERDTLLKAGSSQGTAHVRFGRSDSVPLVLASSLHVVKPADTEVKPNVEVRKVVPVVTAPIARGKQVGSLELWVDGSKVSVAPLVATSDVQVVSINKAVSSNPGWFAGFGILALMGTSYAAKIAKGARIRRYRLKARMRGANHRG